MYIVSIVFKLCKSKLKVFSYFEKPTLLCVNSDDVMFCHEVFGPKTKYAQTHTRAPQTTPPHSNSALLP